MRQPFGRGHFGVAIALLCLGFSSIIFAAADPVVLDKQQQLDRFTFWDNKDWGWYKANIPFFESPDNDIDTVYYYRWELITKHMTYVSPEAGYAFTEFLNHPPIICSFGLQMSDLRWLKDRRIPQDYIQYWYQMPGAGPRGYSNWYSSEVWANYLVDGDKAFVVDQLPSMEKQYGGWLNEHWDGEKGMFHWSGMHDGMELNIASMQTQKPFDGADSYRPTLNSYVYGDLLATANTAELAGNGDKAASYRAKAEDLKQRVQRELWDPKRDFFVDEFRDNETSLDGKYTIKAGTLIYQDGQFAGDPHGRELSGYIPWMFDLPDKSKGYEAAWKGVSDPDVFLAKYGLTFVERHDPMFLITQGGGCVWRGNNWPYADSETLEAMANVLNDYPQNVITKEDYFKVFKAYTQTHLAGDRPYIAEDCNPDTGFWINNGLNASEHYFHSSYINLLITGLVGLRPRADNVVEINPLIPEQWNYFALDDIAYHGHRLSIIWDRDGTHYSRGKGLTVWADGAAIGMRNSIGDLQANLPAAGPAPQPVDRPINFAINVNGAYFPKVETTFTAAGTKTANMFDGSFYYCANRPVNRWTTEGSPHATDSVTVDFGIERPLESVKLYLLDDGEGKTVRAPASYEIDYWDGSNWKAVPDQKRTPEQPVGHCPNLVEFPVLDTSRIRAVFTPRPNSAVGLTELEAWGHAPFPLAVPSTPVDDLALKATATASFTCPEDRIEQINDGILSQRGGPRNRWTAYGSPNGSDWVQLNLNQPANIGRVTICWYDDGGGVRLPKDYKIQYWSGTDWIDAKEIPPRSSLAPIEINDEINIEPVETDKLRFTFDHNLPAKTGVTELMLWEK